MIESICIAPKGLDEQELLHFAQREGYGVELSVLMDPNELQQSDKVLERYKPLLAEFTQPLSFHGPVYDINPASLDKAILAASQQRYRQAISIALALGATSLVVHSQYTPIYAVADVYEPWLEANVRFFKQLVADLLQGSQLTLVIENMMDEDARVLCDLVDRIDSPNVKACLDIGHVELFSPVPALQWIDRLGERLTHVHVHDNNGLLDEHRGFGEGVVPVESLIKAFQVTPHTHRMVLEVHDWQEMQRSLMSLRQWLSLDESTQEAITANLASSAPLELNQHAGFLI